MKKQTQNNYLILNLEQLTDTQLEAISGGVIIPELPEPAPEYPRPGLIIDLPKPEEPEPYLPPGVPPTNTF